MESIAMTKRIPTETRFWTKVLKRRKSECWLWTASVSKDGYGQFWNGEHYPNGQPIFVLAHRWVYEHAIGKIPKGFVVSHRCDNPSCVNPNHLLATTQRENVRDCINKKRHRNARKMLTDQERIEILERHQGRFGMTKALATEYGVCPATISRLRHGRRS